MSQEPAKPLPQQTQQPQQPAATTAANREHPKEEEYDEEENGDDEDEEYEDDDEEEEEPQLRYQRLGGDVTKILEKDAASCMVLHEKYLALGTHYGTVYQMDFYGNETACFTAHTGTVTELSIDTTGEWLASCSTDGTVVVQSLTSPDRQVTSFNRPVTALAIDPCYAHKSSRQYCIGNKGGQVIMCSRGFMGRRKEAVLHQGEGTVHALRWRGTLIAWCSDRSTQVYDTVSGQRIGVIQHPPRMPPPDMYRCCLCWESETSLVVAVGASIKIARIKPRAVSEGTGLLAGSGSGSGSGGFGSGGFGGGGFGGGGFGGFGGGFGLGGSGGGEGHGLGGETRMLCVEITHSLELEFNICGIAPFEEKSLVVFAYPDDDASGRRQKPELRTVTRSGEELSTDGLPIKNFEKYRAMDYRLDYLPAEWLFFLVAPSEIIVAKPRDLDDHVAWLMQQGHYSEALAAAREGAAQLHTHSVTAIGEQYLEHLLTTEHNAEEAARQCPGILGRDADLWQKWIIRFHQLGELRAITPVVPVSDPRLSDTIYALVLNQHLCDDHKLFLATLTQWPHDIYDTNGIITAVCKKVREHPDDRDLLHALAMLYTFKGQYADTLGVYLRLHEGPVFKLIVEHDLFGAIADKLVALMAFDEAESVKMLVAHVDRVPVAQVVAQLAGHPRYQLAYLHALFEKDHNLGSEFHRLLVDLYATYDPSKLLPFLKQSNAYSLEDALKVCEQHRLYPEMAFVLQRMGSTHEALSLIVNRVGDIRMAVDFVQAQNDPDLLEELITDALRSPEHTSALLENIGSSVDPIRLIQRIPDGMQIPNLRDHLVKMMNDHNLQMSLQEGCNTILLTDCVELFTTLYAKRCRAARVDDDTRCATCQGIITRARADDVVAFGCGHVYHLTCLANASASTLAPVPPSSTAHPAPAVATTASEAQAQQAQAQGQQGQGAQAQAQAQAQAPQQQQQSVPQADRLWCVICKSAQHKRMLARQQQLAAQQQQMQRAAMLRRAAAAPRIQPATAAVAAAAAASAMSKQTNPFL